MECHIELERILNHHCVAQNINTRINLNDTRDPPEWIINNRWEELSEEDIESYDTIEEIEEEENESDSEFSSSSDYDFE